MRHIKKASYALLGLIVAITMTACGGGGGGGTAPAATTTTGTITGFGSVIVNGVKFSRKTGLADDRIKLRFENNTSAAENNLRVGMVVKVKGTVNNATGTGEYESIEFQPEVRGPLDNNGVDLVNDRLTILGRQVQVEANTQFDSIRDLAEINGELQAGRHPELEISGSLDNTGVFHASRIARKSLDFTNGVVEIKGAIAASPTPTATGFSIGTQAIVVNGSTVFANMTAAQIAAGLLVEVKGTLNAGVFTATRVEKKNAVEAQVNDNVNVKGVAAGPVANNSFTLSGPNGPITVTTATAVFLKGNAVATSAIVAAGAKLEVEGALQANGSIAATKVAVEVEKTVKLEGNAEAGAFNAAANTLTLNGVTVAIATTTRLLDAAGQPLVLSSIAAGDHLQIVGVFDSATNKVTASQVQRSSASTLVFVQGPVTAIASPRLTLLGTITVDTGTITQAGNFEDNRTGTKVAFGNTLAASQAAFFAALTTDGLSVVKAKGTITGTTLAATEVELEQPL